MTPIAAIVSSSCSFLLSRSGSFGMNLSPFPFLGGMPDPSLREMLSDAAGDDPIVFNTLSGDELDATYSSGHFPSFSAWSLRYVYFPATRDGRVARAPRHPPFMGTPPDRLADWKTDPVGG